MLSDELFTWYQPQVFVSEIKTQSNTINHLLRAGRCGILRSTTYWEQDAVAYFVVQLIKSRELWYKSRKFIKGVTPSLDFGSLFHSIFECLKFKLICAQRPFQYETLPKFFAKLKSLI